MNILMTVANPFTHDPRVYNEAKSLVDEGHSVTVLAWDNSETNIQQENKEGIKIVRSYNSSYVNLLPYDILRLQFWWRKGFKDALKIHKRQSFEVIHSHDFSSLPIGVKLKKKLDLPLIYDAHEIWGLMVEKDMPKVMANFYLLKEKKLIKYVDKIITAENKYSNYFNSITNKELLPILNCKNLITYRYIPPENEILILMYIGVLSPPRFLVIKSNTY